MGSKATENLVTLFLYDFQSEIVILECEWQK